MGNNDFLLEEINKIKDSCQEKLKTLHNSNREELTAALSNQTIENLDRLFHEKLSKFEIELGRKKIDESTRKDDFKPANFLRSKETKEREQLSKELAS